MLKAFKKIINNQHGWLGAAIGAGASILGQSSANQQSKASTQKQIDFQYSQSNTAYQRGMADMKKAGLNPALAYKQGGAQTSSGASYQAQNVAPDMSERLATTAKGKATEELMHNTIEKTKAEIRDINSATLLKQKQAELTQTNSSVLAKELPGAKLKGGIMNRVLDYFSNSAQSRNAKPKGYKSFPTEHLKE